LRLFAVLILVGLAAPAWAGDAGELLRLRETLTTHVTNNIWKGAERTFLQMEEMDARGTVDLTADDWLLGVRIARTLGDMRGVKRRLQAAFELAPNDDLRRELTNIASSFGPVIIEVSGKGVDGLVAESPPFEPDKRAAIEAARARIAAGQGFDGLLPLGRYTLSGTAFEVATGAIDAVRVRVASDGTVRTDRVTGGGGGDEPGLEVLLDLGVAFTAATGATEGVQPAPFSGPGARIGVGVNLWPAEQLGVQVEIGYHGLIGGGGDKASGLPANALHMGFASIGPALRAGDLTLTVGGEAAFGAGRANGLDLDAWSALCDTRPDDVRCAGQGVASDDALSRTSMTGQVVALGVVAGGTWTLGELGPARPAVGLAGGALSDGARWLPWAQAALVIRL
jgi:hypothetical protein